MSINIEKEKLQKLLENTQKSYPPHYPTKRHDIGRELPNLLEHLDMLVNYLGFDNANIGIKNIIAKSLSEILILAGYNGIINSDGGVNSGNFILDKEENENGTKITIEINDEQKNSLEINYLNDGKITISNKFRFIETKGNSYENSIISYNINNPNIFRCDSILRNGSKYQYVSEFLENGTESKREFKIFPKIKNVENDNQCVFGTIERDNENFGIVSLNIDMNDGNYGSIITQNEIKKIHELKEIKIPLYSILEEKITDLNLLEILGTDDKTDKWTGSIGNISYLFSSNSNTYIEENKEEMLKTSEKIFQNIYSLEINPLSFSLTNIVVDSPYSKEIVNSISKQYNNNIQKQ